MDPLKSDPKRQAVATLKGFSYQIWQTVLLWLSLKDDEAIFLEGAEDIDVLGPGHAETVQVKETAGSGPITLRSQDVVLAITHFWEHQLANPYITIAFRFLTTAERGCERPNPFGDQRGLDLWDSCKYPGTDMSLLKDFLRNHEGLPLDLKSFIAAAPDEVLRNRLVSRIEWDTGNKAQPYVEDAVNRKISAYGDRMLNLLPSESIKLVDHLLRHAWDVVRREESRRLDLWDFRRLFEEVMTERISKSEIQSLRRAAQVQAQAMSQFGDLTASQASRYYPSRSFTGSILEEFSPPDTHKLAQRQEFVAEMHAQLNLMGILVIKGSTGMGKSMLATMVARRYKGAWRRLDMRGHAPKQIADKLNYATQLVEQGASQVDCIIDDLNFDRNTNVYENALGRFVYAIRLYGGRVIITTQGSMPSRIVNLYDIPAKSFAEIALLSEDEVKELIANYGCPGGHKLKGWGRIVFINTQGHPLLAHARVRTLENLGWPSPTAEDLSAIQDLSDIRREFRRSLAEQLSDEPRLLLYRLSIIGNRFKRQHALDMGSQAPQIATPGDAFDRLIGPWVEQVDSTRYRLSPLLDNAASEVFTDREVKELHRAAAASFASQETIDPLEISAVLLHGFLGQAQEPLLRLVMSTFSMEEAYWSVVSRVIDWFGYLQLGSGQKLFEASPFLNVLLRRLQYKVVATLHPDRAGNVAEVWRQEIDELSSPEFYAGTKPGMLFAYLNEIIFSIEIPIPIHRIVAYISEAIALSRNYSAIFPDHPEHRDAFENNVSAVVTPYRYLGVAIGRCKHAVDVVNFLTAIDERSDDVIEVIWTTFKHDDYLAMMLIDRIWLNEAAASAPDWNRCIYTIEIVAQLAKKRSATALLAAAHRASAIVQEEYLKNTDEALRTLSEAQVSLGGPYPFLEDYRAKILLFKKRYAEALNIWQEILPALETERKLGLGPSYRDAEICSARIGDWRKAADFARKGEEATHQFWDGIPSGGAKTTLVDVIAAGFKADYAFALWKAGQRANSVREFGGILENFKHLPSPEEDIKSELLYRRVGHAIGWLNQSLEGDDSFPEPHPGCFSDPEVIHEMKDTTLPPLVSHWYLLAKVECSLKLGDAIFRRFEEEHIRVSQLPYTVGYLDLRIRHSLRNLQLENLVSDGLKQSVSLKTYSAEQQMNIGDWSNTEMVIRLVFAALVMAVGSKRYDIIAVDQWKRDSLSHAELRDSLNRWFDFIQSSLSTNSEDLTIVLRNNDAASEYRLVAALLLSADDSPDVENRFYANALLTTPDFHKPWQVETENIVASLIIDRWIQVAEHERFSLRSPSVTAPQIVNACRDESCHGLKKAARVLLAARAAVKASIADSLLEQIERQAK